MSSGRAVQPRTGEVYRHQTITKVVEPAPEPEVDRMAITHAVVEVRDKRGRVKELEYPVLWWPRH